MSTLGKVGAVLLGIVLVAVLAVSIVDSELRVSGIVFVAMVCIIWQATREVSEGTGI